MSSLLPYHRSKCQEYEEWRTARRRNWTKGVRLAVVGNLSFYYKAGSVEAMNKSVSVE